MARAKCLLLQVHEVLTAIWEIENSAGLQVDMIFISKAGEFLSREYDKNMTI